MRLVMVLLVMIIASTAYAESPPSNLPTEPQEILTEDTLTTKSSIQPMFAFGWFHRMDGTNYNRGSQKYMFTGNLDFLKRYSDPSTWGAGIRCSIDDDGYRLGARFLYRHRLGNSAKGYWQLAPGLAIFGSDQQRTLIMPTGFCELELGHETWGALSLGVEVVPFEDQFRGLVYNPETMLSEFSSDGEGTEVSYYAGVKAAGWKGLLILTALSVALVAAMKDMN